MSGDEALYRQYLSGDDTGLEALMKQYGDPLTMYIDGYLHDVHEAEELMLDVFAYLFTKKPRIRDGGFKAYLYKARATWRCAAKAGGSACSASMSWRTSRTAGFWRRRLSGRRSAAASCTSAWTK